METTVRKMSIYVFIVVATTALTLGVSNTLAASNTHKDVQVSNSSSDEYFPTPATIKATHHNNMKLASSGGANPTSTSSDNSIGSGSDDIAAMGWGPSQTHNHNMKGSDRSTAGNGDGSYSATQYGSHHHRSTNDDMSVDIY
jgi:hypothetical protein